MSLTATSRVASRVPAKSAMVEAVGLCKSFGQTRALAGVDLRVGEGEVVALLGPNGAGKTTLVRVLTTLLVPDGGRASVAGHDVVAAAERVRLAIGLAGQYASVDELLTGRENLELVGQLYHLQRAECRRLAAGILERLSLTDAADREVRTYSGGMRRRLDIGASLIGRPRVLFLDEPTTGLDPRTRNELWEFIEELVADGTTLLLTTQYMEEAERLADRIVVIDNGQVIAHGTPAELEEQLGGDVLEARVADRADVERAAGVLAALGAGAPHVNPHERRVSLPTKGGMHMLLSAARRFEDDGIELDDLGLRHPSLDDVFLAFTGNSTTNGSNNFSPADPPAAIPPDPPADDPPPSLPAPRLSAAVGARDTAGIAKRNLLRTLRTPQLLLIAAIQPALLLILFRYVLGGAIRLRHGSYVEYVVPAIFLEAVIIGGMATAIGLAEDLKSGIIDRFRSLPMARPAVLAGRTVADLARSTFSLAVMVALGLLVGFRFHTAIPDILLGFALVLAFGFAFSWMYATIALSTRDPETAQVAAVLPFFILVFASSAVVPVASMPGWLQGFARHQPVSVTIDAVRALLEGGAAGHLVWQSLAWSVGILVVFFTLSVRLYRNVTS